MVKSKICKEEDCIQKTPIALTQQSIMNIETKIDKIDVKLDNFIDKCDKEYATKEDLKNNSEKINKIENILGKINWIIISSVILALLALIIKMN